MNENKLTPKQEEVLGVLKKYETKYGYSPSYRDLVRETTLNSTSHVDYYLKQLEEIGEVTLPEGKSRAIRLAKNAIDGTSASLSIPVVGKIVAGELAPVPGSDFDYYGYEDRIDVGAGQLPGSSDETPYFALEVDGDSMVDANIQNGDIVILRQVANVHNGDLVAAWLLDKEETTLKRFYAEKGKVRLQPANKHYKPIIVDDPSSVRVQGKVYMVVRNCARI
jgi:repressor LexA